MYFVPSINAETIARSSDLMARYLEKEISQRLYGKSGQFHIKTAIPTSYIAVVEAFGTKRADFAALTSFSYILTRDIKKYPAEVFMIVERQNSDKYKGQIITHVDSGINKLEDLQGKKFAFTDPSSTSGYILPKMLFKEKGIQLGQTVFGQKHDNVVTMVYQKQVDAGATYYVEPEIIEKDGKTVEQFLDARYRVRTQFPDVGEKVKIIGFTQEVPEDPWVLRTNIFADKAKNEKFRKILTESLMAYSKSPEGAKDLQQNHTISGLAPTTDSVYDEVRKIIKSVDLNIEKLVK